MREQELEVVKTAYFLEDQIVHQTQELQRVNGDKPVPRNRENRIWKSTPHRRFPTRKSSRWSICRSLCGGSYG